jgi:hypothetical protein
MIVLCNIEDYRETVDDFKEQWMIALLLELGLEEQHLIEPTSDETLRAMGTLGVEVYDILGTDETDILHRGELIAQWKQPSRRIIKEHGGEKYYQVKFNFWPKLDLGEEDDE